MRDTMALFSLEIPNRSRNDELVSASRCKPDAVRGERLTLLFQLINILLIRVKFQEKLRFFCPDLNG